MSSNRWNSRRTFCICYFLTFKALLNTLNVWNMPGKSLFVIPPFKINLLVTIISIWSARWVRNNISNEGGFIPPLNKISWKRSFSSLLKNSSLSCWEKALIHCLKTKRKKLRSKCPSKTIISLESKFYFLIKLILKSSPPMDIPFCIVSVISHAKVVRKWPSFRKNSKTQASTNSESTWKRSISMDLTSYSILSKTLSRLQSLISTGSFKKNLQTIKLQNKRQKNHQSKSS